MAAALEHAREQVEEEQAGEVADLEEELWDEHEQDRDDEDGSRAHAFLLSAWWTGRDGSTPQAASRPDSVMPTRGRVGSSGRTTRTGWAARPRNPHSAAFWRCVAVVWPFVAPWGWRGGARPLPAASRPTPGMECQLALLEAVAVCGSIRDARN